MQRVVSGSLNELAVHCMSLEKLHRFVVWSDGNW